MDTQTTPSGPSGAWLLPATLALVVGSFAAGHVLLKAGLGLIGAVLSTAVFMWGYESRMIQVDAAGYKLSPACKSDYAAGEKFLTGLVLLVLFFVPTLQAWFIGAGLGLRFILWPLILK